MRSNLLENYLNLPNKLPKQQNISTPFYSKFQEVILEVEPIAGETLPIGITVMAELAQ